MEPFLCFLSIPLELSDDPRGQIVVPTCHAVIQSNEKAWEQVENILNRLQDASIGAVLDANEKQSREVSPAIALEIQDVYTTQTLALRARVLNASKIPPLEAELQLIRSYAQSRAVPVKINGESLPIQCPVTVAPCVFGPFRLVADARSQQTIACSS